MTKNGSARWYALGGCVLVILLAASVASVHSQGFEFPGVSYPRGQDVSPTFDGWERNPDGTSTLYFGYYNRNTQEEVDIPVGPENSFDYGNADQGQPTHFYPGRRWFVFKVVVPKDWPVDKRVVWTLANRGRTNLAKGWLEPEWEVEGSGIFLTGYRNRVPPYEEEIKPAMIAITAGPDQTVTLPSTVTLTATANASSKPDIEAGANLKGVQIRWMLYRGPAKVQFDPPASPIFKENPAKSETKISFNAPGNYRIRALATDGAIFSVHDFNVKVNPGPSADKH